MRFRFLVGVAAAVGTVVFSGAPGLSGAAGASPHVRVTTLNFKGSFVPQQVVTSGSELWVLGSGSPRTFTKCGVEEIDPKTFKKTLYSLPKCALDVVGAPNKLYLAVSTPIASHNPNVLAIRMEVFDTRTHRTNVLTPIDAKLVGSSVAHQALAYGNGSLWFYGYGSPATPEVVRISPSSGKVLSKSTHVPGIGGVFPAVLATNGAVWMAGGGGGPPSIERMRLGAKLPSTVFTGPQDSSIDWLAAAQGRVWAEVVTQRGTSDGTPSAQLAEFNVSGQLLHETSPISAGEFDFPLVSTITSLWSAGVGASCTGSQSVIAIDPTTLSSTSVATLNTPLPPCEEELWGSQLVGVGSRVFLLDPTGTTGGVLYRFEA